MSYLKARVDQKKKINDTYQEKLFSAAALVLPAVVARLPDDASSSEMVDEAIVLAKDLLAALGYFTIDGEGKKNGKG